MLCKSKKRMLAQPSSRMHLLAACSRLASVAYDVNPEHAVRVTPNPPRWRSCLAQQMYPRSHCPARHPSRALAATYK